MLGDVIGAQRNRDHGTRRRRMHQPRPRGYRGDRGRQIEDARQGGGDVLADAVPGQRRRANAVGLDQRRKRIFDCEQRGLGVIGAGQVGASPLEHLRAQVDTEFVAEALGAPVEMLGVDRLGLVKAACHPGVLGALSREQEDHPVARFGCVDGFAFEHVVVFVRFQHASRLLVTVHDRCSPALLGSPALERERYVRQFRRLRTGQLGRQFGAQFA